MHANIEDSIEKLDAVLNVMGNIREAWLGIRDEVMTVAR
jgi:flagellin-specific chaperone FliS